MDSKKRQRKLNLTLIGLATVSVGMFGYSNVYLPNFAEEDTVTVYVASQDIPANVNLESGMFKPVKIAEKSYIPGSVKSLEEVQGKQLKGYLGNGELLSTQRFSDSIHSEGSLLTEIAAPTSIPLQHNDTIRIYVQYRDGGKVAIEELFHQKKVVAKDRINGGSTLGQKVEDATSAAVSSSNDGSVVYVYLTDKETMKYQEAVSTGDLFLVKVTQEESENTLSSGVQVSKHDAKVDEKEEEGGTIALYEMKEGDNITSVAKKFMTSEDRIVALNDGQTVFDVGNKINVPGN